MPLCHGNEEPCNITTVWNGRLPIRIFPSEVLPPIPVYPCSMSKLSLAFVLLLKIALKVLTLYKSFNLLTFGFSCSLHTRVLSGALVEV